MKLKEIVTVCFVLILTTGCMIKEIVRNKQVDEVNTNRIIPGSAIYGSDDRVEVADSKNLRYQKWARSSANMINKKFFSLQPDGKYEVSDKTLIEYYKVCPTERFAYQPSPGECSGFLVGEDLLVTAGHCVNEAGGCENYLWAFDYHYSPDLTLPTSSVYSCKEIIKVEYIFYERDYAIIRLDRKVTDREPFKFRRSGEVEVGDPLVVIGNPLGLPTKIIDNGVVRSNNGIPFFRTDLDVFVGSSGSGVINANSGVIEGIVSGGEIDFVESPDGQKCFVANRCSQDDCYGEAVYKITNIKDILEELGL